MRCACCGQNQPEDAVDTDFCSAACLAYRRSAWFMRPLDVLWGAWIVWRRPRLIALSLVPLFLTLLVLLTALTLSFQLLNQGSHVWLENSVSSTWGLPLLQTLTGALSAFSVLLLVLVLFLPLAALITMPFMDPLVDQIEAHLLGEARPGVPFQLGFVLREMLCLMGLKCLLLLPMLLFWIPVLGPLLVLISLALVLSLDFFDLIWMRKGYRFKEKIIFLRQNLGAWLLFTLPLVVMLWIPVLQLLILPAASAGAVRLFFAAQK